MNITGFARVRSSFEDAMSSIQFPITYEQWLGIKDQYKAAALFVNFYDQICLARSKWLCGFITEGEDSSIVLQRLLKNVEVLKNDRKRFTKNYMFRVAYNAIGELRKIQGTVDFYNLTESNIKISASGEEVDEFSTRIGEEYDGVSEMVRSQYSDAFWSVVNGLDKDSKRLVEALLGGKPVGKKIEAKKEVLMAGLRSKFGAFRTEFYDDKADSSLTFRKVLVNDDSVESAVVVMPDGEKAVYYGEKEETENGRCIVFFGSKKDYCIPVRNAVNLTVLDVTLYK